MDALLPGTTAFDELRNDPRVWHFAFHGARDVAEMLVAGRERQYLQAFFHARMFNSSAIDSTDFDVYVSAYSAPGAMRAGFEVYRAFGSNNEPVAPSPLRKDRRPTGRRPPAPRSLSNEGIIGVSLDTLR